MLKFFGKGKETELKPVYEKERHNCPFYGFFLGLNNALMDQNGNQCALITNSYSPCHMEIRAKTPN